MFKIKCLICIVFGTVLCVFILKGALLMARYGITVSTTGCDNQDHNETNATVSDEYIFTVIVYGIVSLLRILEYWLLARQFYFFLFQQNEIKPGVFFKIHPRRHCYVTLFSIFLLPYFLLGFVIPAFGIYQEVEHAEGVAPCYQHYYEIYVSYCVVNFFRYMLAYAVRIIMFFTSLSLSKLWLLDHVDEPHNIGLVKCQNDDGGTFPTALGPERQP